MNATLFLVVATVYFRCSYIISLHLAIATLY